MSSTTAPPTETVLQSSPEEEQQIIDIFEAKAKCISTIDDSWISTWANLIEKHFKLETRNPIRLKSIATLSQIFSKYHVLYADELMSKVVLPNFVDVDQENDPDVRKPIVHLLFDIASVCLSNKHCNAILAIIRRILTRPFNQKVAENNGLVYIIGNVDIIDSRLIITNLSKLLRARLMRLPIDSAVNILDILVSYLNLTYKCPMNDPVPAEIPMIRRELFTLFLSLRCNKYGHLGIIGNDQEITTVMYSPFVICMKNLRQMNQSTGADTSTQMSSAPQISNNQLSSHNHPMHIPTNHPHCQSSGQNIFLPNVLRPNCPIESRCINLDGMIGGFIDCIVQETNPDVLKLVLDGLPDLLSNKHLINTTTDERINQLCLALGNLILPSKSAVRQNSMKIDIAKCGLRCLTSILIYKKQLDQKSIKVMLAAFEDSLKVSRQSIVPLFTTCLIELQDSSEMTKFVPVVLDRLRRFSTTVNLGISMLEFLSYLILFPKLYENFSEDEYKFIFAIALPYTNPFKFSDYITCLAFRVIAMWYLNCRPAPRSVFVDLVRKSLQSNVIQPFKENSMPLCPPVPNSITHTPPIFTHSCPPTMSPIDQRKRSSSLNAEHGFRQQQSFGFPSPQQSLQVNEELIETFADLLSRYTHGQYLAIAPKSDCTEKLIDRCTSQTWLNGNSLVTITAGKAGNGWAEIMVRRPTGNTSWIGRLQNAAGALQTFNQQIYADHLNFGSDIISLFSSFVIGLDEDCATIESYTQTLSSTNSSLSASPSTLASSESSPPFGMCKSRNPTPLPKDKKFDVAISNFDLITPYETHKVGVVYVGKDQQDNRAAILSNKCGSPRYYEFLSNIGTCIVLNDIDPEIYFIGGLDVKGDDGKYAYFWKDNVTQVIFHVATFMTSRENDPQCNSKNRHIGNDHVCIVYNDSQTPFKMSTIKGTGQFIMACIVISPMDENNNLIEVQVTPELNKIVGDIEQRVLSNLSTSLYARQTAIHLNLASKIHERRHCKEGFIAREPYVSNWVERLRCIKRMRQRLDEARKMACNNSLSSRCSNTLK